MAIPIAAIRQRIIEIMQGDDGIISPDAGTFEHGAFEGQPDVAKLAKLRQTSTATHWFDVVLSPAKTHAASNVSTLTSRRIVTFDVEIPVWTGLATEVNAAARAATLAAIASDCEDAVQSLAYPHNLDATEASTATNIVGGCMSAPDGTRTPEWKTEDEAWEKRWLKSVIVGSIIVSVASLYAILPSQLTWRGEQVTWRGEPVTWRA